MRAYEFITDADTTFNARMWTHLVLPHEWAGIYGSVRTLYNHYKRISKNFTLAYDDAGITSSEIIRVSAYINRIQKKYDREIVQHTQLYDMITELQTYFIAPTVNDMETQTIYLTMQQRERLMQLLHTPATRKFTRIDDMTKQAAAQFNVTYAEHPVYVAEDMPKPLDYFGSISGTEENINWLLLHL